MFENLLGNDLVKEQLKTMVQNGRMGQSFLFSGPEGIGKSLFAQELADHILHNKNKRKHPDLHHYRPQGKIGMHSIETMREFIEDVYLAPLEAQYKVYIIHDADRMLPYSANALLKTFEEPSKNSIIILLSSKPDKILPTIRSRCRTIRFAPIEEPLIKKFLINKGLEEDRAAFRARLSEGSLSYALKEENQLREDVLDLLSQPRFSTWRDLMDGASMVSKYIEMAQEEVKKELTPETKELNASQRQVIEKEIDGALSVSLTQMMNEVFSIILSWYRDLELIKSKSDTKYLMNSERKDAMIQALIRDESITLNKLQKMILEARVALERSTPIQQILENLFLKMERI